MPAYVNIDTQDPERITPFWCDLLGVKVQSIRDDGRYIVLQPAPSLGGLMLVFQRVPESKVGKNRTKRVEALGGHWIEPGTTRELDGFEWRCMADPDDNEFCIMSGALSS
jgi:predicted enzyme related to lactoylglutathione lyase